MMSKFLAVASIVAISFLGLNLPAANAQPAPPEITFGDGDYLDPWINCRVWTGYTMKDKYASGTVDENGEATADGDTYLGYTGGGTEMGFNLKKGKLTGSASLSTKFSYEDVDMGRALGVSVKYQVNDDLIFHYGNGNDGHMPYKGDQPWAASPNDDGFRGYSVGGGQTMIDVAYKGAYLGFFRKGYCSLSKFDSSSDNTTTDYTIPRMVVGYQFSGPLSAGVAGLYQTKKLDDFQYEVDPDGTAGSGDELTYTIAENLVSYAGSFNVGYMVGPIHAAAHAYYQVNGAEMGFFPPDTLAEIDSTDPEKICDTTQMGGNFVLAYKLNSVEPCAGVAYKVSSNDNWEKDDASMAYFFRLKFDITPGFNIQPGVIITDNMKSHGTKGNPDSVVKEGTTTNFGVFLETTI